MNINPKVSIVIPVYNGRNFLSEAIDSCLAQTYPNIEIVVVNDGSTDGGKTDEVIRSYGDKVIAVPKKNGGVASALNTAISHMTGDYFSWLSHDDLYTPDKIEKQINFLKKIGFGKRIVYCNYSVFTDHPDAALPVALDGVPFENFRHWLTVKNELHGCTLLIPRSAFVDSGHFDEALKTTQDYDLWFRMAENYSFVHIPDVLVKARSHKDQDTLKMTDIVLSECDALLAKFVYQLTKDEVYNATQTSLDVSYDEIATSMRKRGFKKAEAAATKIANSCRTFEKRKIGFGNFASFAEEIKFKIRRHLPPSLKCMLKKFLFGRSSTNMGASSSLREKFSEIYHKNLFAGRKSRSGEGSDLVQTEIIRREIPRIIQKYKVKTFLDAPCGDWYWMSHTDLGVQKYIGVDIVEDMIKINQEKFGNESISFQSVNLTDGRVPSADLIFSRDCLVHLSYEDAFAILQNFKESGAKYLLTTTFTNRAKNQDLIDEHGNHLFWRTLNMELSPFNFPKPLELINEGCMEDDGAYKDKCLGLWLLEDLLPCKE